MTDIKTLWQNQPTEENRMITLSDIRERAGALQHASGYAMAGSIFIRSPMSPLHST